MAAVILGAVRRAVVGLARVAGWSVLGGLAIVLDTTQTLLNLAQVGIGMCALMAVLVTLGDVLARRLTSPR